ncbi:MAG: phage tail protein [Bacteroidales bacterium]|nr:phage tail protein [Bacteroidales bacterium]
MTAEKQGAWPLPAFYFKIEIEGVGEFLVREVSGLEMEAQIIEYRQGNSREFSTIKMPGLKKYLVTLKKGIFESGNKFFDWLNEIKMNTIKRRPVTISLLDESGNPVMIWKLTNAWPSKITGVSLKQDGNETVFESMELAHEGITTEN